jgi:hypothetical protein
VVGRQYPVETGERVPGRRDQRGQPRHQLKGLRHPVGSAATPWLLQGAGDAAVGQRREALLAQRWPGAVAKEALSPFSVCGRHLHASMEAEALRLGAHRSSRAEAEAAVCLVALLVISFRRSAAQR